MLTISLRTVLIYLFLLVCIRLMGKRQIGELQTSEFIITILLSEIASVPISNPSSPLLHSLVPVLILVFLEILISFVLLRLNPLKRLFYGFPAVLINRGEIDLEQMRKNRMELEELLSELRQKGYSDPADVRYAILEENGKLSVFPNADRAPATPSDLGVAVEESGIAHAVVADGRIISNNLRLAGWDEGRLTKELRKHGLALAEVFVLTVDDAGKITCILKKDGRAV